MFVQGITKFSAKYERIIKKHYGLGLDRNAFVHFGQSLIVAIKNVIGKDFSVEEVNAFRRVYVLLATPMVLALEQSSQLKEIRPSVGPGRSVSLANAENVILEHAVVGVDSDSESEDSSDEDQLTNQFYRQNLHRDSYVLSDPVIMGDRVYSDGDEDEV